MTKSILLIDDDGDDVWLFTEALKSVDPLILCHYASDGQDGLDKLKEIEMPDLIFLDINMPVMDGWECLVHIKKNDTLKSIPVIMYSTSSYLEDISKAFDLGALCFLSKPFDFKDLKSTLEFVVTHLKENSLPEMRKGHKHLRFD